MSKIVNVLIGAGLIVVSAGVGYIQGAKCPMKAGNLKDYLTVKKSPLLAEVGQRKIYQEDVEAFKNTIPQLKALPLDMVQSQLLNVMIDNAAILELAKEQNIMKDKEVASQARLAMEQAVVNAYIMKQVDKEVTREKLIEKYQEHLKDYKAEDEIKARHILVKTEEEAKDIIARLIKGEDFKKLAAANSIDEGTAQVGGELGYFLKDMMVPEFGNAVFAMRKGELTQKPIRSDFGYHVVEVEDRRVSAPPSFVSVEDALKKEYQQELLPQIFEAEKAKVHIVMHDVAAEDAVVEAEEVEATEETPVTEEVVEEVTEETPVETTEEVTEEETEAETEEK